MALGYLQSNKELSFLKHICFEIQILIFSTLNYQEKSQCFLGKAQACLFVKKV